MSMRNALHILGSQVHRLPVATATMSFLVLMLYGGSCAYIRANRPTRVPIALSGGGVRSPIKLAIGGSSSGSGIAGTENAWRRSRAARRAEAPSAPGAFEGRVQRQRVTRLDTVSLGMPFASIEPALNASYWERRLCEKWALTVTDEGRLDGSREERDALWSVLCAVAEAGPPPTKAFSIPDPSGTWSRIYSVRPIGGMPDRGRPRVRVSFVEEVDSATAIELQPSSSPAAPPEPVPVTSFWWSGFEATGGWDGFTKAHPEVVAEILGWIGRQPAGGFSRLFKCVDAARSVHLITASGLRTEAGVRGAMFSGLGEGITVALPPAGYGSHDFVDLDLERGGPSEAVASADEKLSPAPGIKIGQIEGLSHLDRNVAQIVKRYVFARIKRLRNSAQVYAALEVAPGRRELFGLRLQRDGDAWNAIVEGPFASDVVCNPSAAPADLVRQALDALPTDAATLRAWWGDRHPKAMLPTHLTHASEIRSRIETILTHELSPLFFAQNYELSTVAPAQGVARLKSQHLDASEYGGLHAWDDRDFLMLELSLQRLSPRMLSALRGTYLVRKSEPLARGAAASAARTAGKTYTYGELHTVIIYDYAYARLDECFEGGADASPEPLRTYLHEFGHVVGASQDSSVLERFNEAFLSTDARELTWYAQSAPETELFPEAFATYHLGGPWLLENHPKLHAWLGHLVETGLPR